MAAKGRKRNSAFPGLLVLALLLLIGAHLLGLQRKIEGAETEKQALAAQVEAQRRENESLKAALSKAGDEEYLQQLAREQLDMVAPGEKVFYDVST